MFLSECCKEADAMRYPDGVSNSRQNGSLVGTPPSDPSHEDRTLFPLRGFSIYCHTHSTHSSSHVFQRPADYLVLKSGGAPTRIMGPSGHPGLRHTFQSRSGAIEAMGGPAQN